jgi:HemY protein
MAELEEIEHGDEGRVREWMGRAMRASGDPVWTADGVVSDRWLPVSPNGRLDGFEWKPPLAELGVSQPVIEITPPPLTPAAAPIDDVTDDGTVSPPTPDLPAPASAPSSDKGRNPPKVTVAKARPAEPVIPLVHAPDDPGTDSGLDGDPAPEMPTQPPLRDTWQRLRQFFR